MSADDMPMRKEDEDELNQENCNKQDQQSDSYSQKGNLGKGHMSGGKIKDNAKVAGKFEENNRNKSLNTNNQLTFNIYPSTQSSISEVAANSNQNKKYLFEIKISGELTKDKKAKYKNVKREIEDIVEKLSDLGIEYELKVKYVEKGSIKIGLEGNLADFNKLQKLFESGQLNEILGIPIEDIRVVAAANSEEEEINSQKKSRLSKEITNRDARYSSLICADLTDADLSGTNLTHANLRDANLIRADLTGANLNHAYLGGTNLSSAYLGRANLIRADLTGANLNYAYLSHANLSSAYLGGANLMQANLINANLNNAYLIYAKLIRANLSGANLSGVYLICAKLIRSYLRDANLRNANLIRADLTGADLADVDLRDADLTGADLTDTDLNDAKVKNTRFRSNRGISESRKRNLESRGAIFEDFPGDRSGIVTPV